MSTILKALQRLERDKGEGGRARPALSGGLSEELARPGDGPEPGPTEPPHRRGPWWLLAGALLGVALVGAWLAPRAWEALGLGGPEVVIATPPEAAAPAPVAAPPTDPPEAAPSPTVERAEAAVPTPDPVAPPDPAVSSDPVVAPGATTRIEPRPPPAARARDAAPRPSPVVSLASPAPPPARAAERPAPAAPSPAPEPEPEVARSPAPSPPAPEPPAREAAAPARPERPAASPPRPGAAPGAAPPTAATRAASLAPGLRVLRTSWHPSSERRVAVVVAPGADPVELREGDAIGDMVVSRIEPSGVIFLRAGREIRREIGGS